MIDDEPAVLARVFRQLRKEKDWKAALQSLDEYGRRFQGGQLRREADVARIEALLGLGRKNEGLLALDRLSLGPGPADASLRLHRAELRLEQHRIAEAAADFDAVLASGVRGAIEERARYGRSRCWAAPGSRDR